MFLSSTPPRFPHRLRRWLCVGQGAPCGSKDCNVCSICLWGFKLKEELGRTAKAKNFDLRYGEGVYFSSVSGKANDYAENSQKVTIGDICTDDTVDIGMDVGITDRVDISAGTNGFVVAVVIAVVVVVVVAGIVVSLFRLTTRQAVTGLSLWCCSYL